ncbi:hypothetical protein [Tateyamaria sp. SN6-1]|uniref:hypothetical protein n=1 Tax=Tateyamaria sp. SN6-1 TaxID=3092148 RepID=UPI0039F49BC7
MTRCRNSFRRAFANVIRLLAVCMLCSGQAGAQPRDIIVSVYHDFPPFIVNAETREGLSYDLVDLLDARSQGAFRFSVDVMPRQRLNDRLRDGAPGIVLWANPVWFGDGDRTLYLWSPPLLRDRNDVISPRSVALQFDGPQSLIGQTLVGVSGHRYPGVDDYIAQGMIETVNVRSEEALVRFVASARGDVGIVAQSAARYYVDTLGLEDEVYFSGTAHSEYERYILLQPELVAQNPILADLVAEAVTSPAWTDILRRYGFGPDRMP